MFSILNPLDFPLTPPMDLNTPVDATTGEHDMNAGLSPHPMRLRTNKAVGLFGTSRENEDGSSLIRCHEGVDLLAQPGEPVYAVAGGNVISVSDIQDGSPPTHLYWNLKIHHFPLELGLVSYYIHTENPLVNVNESVSAGQRIAEVAPRDVDPHLHFELHQLIDVSIAGPNGGSLPLDPTRALYEWEKKRFKNDAGSRHLPDNPPQREIVRLEEIVRDRMLSFLFIRLEGVEDHLYLPLYKASADELRLREMLMNAFFHNRSVRVVWRKSLFWGEVIDDQSDTSLMNVISEVRLYP